MSDDLVAFLRARLNEDEAGARDAFGSHNDGGPEWTEVSSGALDAGGELHGIGDSAVSRHMASWDPARVLAEVDAKRRIIALHELEWRDRPERSIGEADDPYCAACFGEGYPCETLRLLALPYADNPGYRQEWTP